MFLESNQRSENFENFQAPDVIVRNNNEPTIVREFSLLEHGETNSVPTRLARLRNLISPDLFLWGGCSEDVRKDIYTNDTVVTRRCVPQVKPEVLQDVETPSKM